MKFEDWLSYRGLSASSVDKYFGAVKGQLSEWASDHKLTEGPLISLTSVSTFKVIDSQLRSLPVLQKRNSRGHHMYSSALAKFGEYLNEGLENDLEADLDDLLDDDQITATERRNLVKSRIGQGVFRQRLLTHWKKCAVTGFEDTSLLVASHIKPWRSSDNLERLDGFNGLLLTPNLDKAFDAGLITFAEDGSIRVSPLLTDAEKLGITGTMRINVTPKHEPYMIFHRTKVFRSE
jgi:putative restriction endonuclease